MSQTEGYVKFTQYFEEGASPEPEQIRKLNKIRTRFFDLGLIGMDEQGIGFGNVSIRNPYGGDTSFFISGTATGGKRVLGSNDYAQIVDFDIASNTVTAVGRTRASSESLSHGAVYIARNDIGSVIHVHSEKLYTRMLEDEYSCTPPDAEYGTPEMACEIWRIVDKLKENNGILVMGGHQDGIIAFGSSVTEVEANLIFHYKKYMSCSA